MTLKVRSSEQRIKTRILRVVLAFNTGEFVSSEMKPLKRIELPYGKRDNCSLSGVGTKGSDMGVKLLKFTSFKKDDCQ